MITIDFLEKDIEDYLCSKPSPNSRHTRLTSWFKDLIVIKRQYNIEGLFIDILAYHYKLKHFIIIELKKNDIDLQAYVQALTYKELMESKFPNRRFTVLLIAQNLDERLSYIVKEYSESNLQMEKPVLYQLFDYDFENGISFSWFNKLQRTNCEKLNKLRLNYWETKYPYLKEENDGDISED